MKSRLATLIVIAVLLGFAHSSHAKIETPIAHTDIVDQQLLDEFEVITPENAHRLVKIAKLSNDFVDYSPQWLPNSLQFIKTRDGIWMHTLGKGRLVSRLLIDNRQLYEVVLSNHGKFIAATDNNPDTHAHILNVYDTNNGNLITSIPSSWSGNFSPDDKFMFFNDNQDEINIWNLEQNIFHMKLEEAYVAQFSADSKLIITGDYGLLKTMVWDIQTGNLIHSWVRSSMRLTTVDPNNEVIILSYSDGLIEIRDIVTGAIIRKIQANEGIHNMNFDRGRNRVIAATRNAIQVWSIDSGDLVFQIEGSYYATLSPNKDILLLDGAGEPFIRTTLVETETGKELFRLEDVNQIMFSPNGKFIATKGVLSGISVWAVPQKYF
jgi:WD40 repeat protein